MLVWSQYDFIECLGVVPEVGEYEVSHSFRVERDGLRLDLTVFQDDGDVYLDLFREGVETSVFHMRLIDCPGARCVKNKGGADYVEFAPAKSFGGRYDGQSPIPLGVRVSADPHIRIELF